MKIKLKIAAVLSALLLAGCGSKEPPQTNQSMDDAFASLTQTSAETAPTTVTEVSETEESETEKSETEADKGKVKKYTGHRYILSVDESKWENIMDIFDDIRKFATENDMVDKDRAKRMKEMCDAIFSYREDDSVSFSVMSMEIGEDGQVDYDTFEPIYRQEIDNDPSNNYLSSEKVTVDGVDGILLESLRDGSSISHMSMYVFWNKGRQIVITFYADEEKYEEYLPEFDKIIDDLKFK